ncbi:MAG: efflux RND transporter periplasmic adaptor subunit [Planctomycetota bacterium]|nr:efflux RND transporter periplasmic adaptor subunit [Planctomycetota bacterium]MDA1212312.1 efflux RND transporter periplasmic adaptor subunit [Planctomycetota bacterium]
MTKRALLLTFLGIILVGVLVYSQRRNEPFKVSGLIEADEIRLGSRVGGRVKSVLVEEGDLVTADQLLVELEPYDLSERRAQAAAQLAEQNEQLKKLNAGYRKEEIAQAGARRDQFTAHLQMLENGPRDQEIEAAQADTDLARSQLELATLKHQRAEDLFGRGAMTQQELDQATTELKVARAALTARAAQLALLEEGTRVEEIARAKSQLDEAEEGFKLYSGGFRTEDIAAAEAAVKSAEAALDAIDRQIDELRVSSPVNGVVEAIDLQPGDLVSPNATTVALVDPRDLWVRAYIPEDRLYVKIGQTVAVTVDSYPDREFTGTITYVARQAEFTPSNVQTVEERSKQVFRIKVTLKNEEGDLRPGMAADVWLDRSQVKR